MFENLRFDSGSFTVTNYVLHATVRVTVAICIWPPLIALWSFLLDSDRQ